eukprot:313990-Heterocapsa_arctica.AAC.1
MSSEVWWSVYSFNDRAQWWTEHRAAEKAAQASGTGASSSTALAPAPTTPRPDGLFPQGNYPDDLARHIEEFDDIFEADVGDSLEQPIPDIAAPALCLLGIN